MSFVTLEEKFCLKVYSKYIADERQNNGIKHREVE